MRALVSDDGSDIDDDDDDGGEHGGARSDRWVRRKFVEMVDTAASTPFSLVVAFATMSAIFGAGSFMSAKVMSTTIKLMSEGGGRTRDTLLLLVPSVASVAVCASLQVHWMNVALKFCDCMTVVPTYYALAILFQSFSGGVLFDEFASFGLVQSIVFAIGVSVLVFGVYRLSAGHVVKDSGDVSALDREMERIDRTSKSRASSRWRRAATVTQSTVRMRRRVRTRDAEEEEDEASSASAIRRRLRADSSRRLTIGVM